MTFLTMQSKQLKLRAKKSNNEYKKTEGVLPYNNARVSINFKYLYLYFIIYNFNFYSRTNHNLSPVYFNLIMKLYIKMNYHIIII